MYIKEEEEEESLKKYFFRLHKTDCFNFSN